MKAYNIVSACFAGLLCILFASRAWLYFMLRWPWQVALVDIILSIVFGLLGIYFLRRTRDE